MQCFEHEEMAAVGLCKSCHKAVCRACAITFPKGLACSAECEKDAKELIEMNERGKKLYGIGQYQSNKLASGVIVWLLLSAVMLFTVIYFSIAKGRFDYFLSAITAVFFVITAVVYRASKSTGIKC